MEHQLIHATVPCICLLACLPALPRPAPPRPAPPRPAAFLDTFIALVDDWGALGVAAYVAVYAALEILAGVVGGRLGRVGAVSPLQPRPRSCHSTLPSSRLRLPARPPARLPAVPAIPLTMTAGAIFGVPAGTAVVSLAATLACTGAFLISRCVFRCCGGGVWCVYVWRGVGGRGREWSSRL